MFAVPKLVIVTDLAKDGVIYTKFGDIRDSRSALSELSRAQPGWLIKFISNKEFMRHFKPVDSTQISDYDDQIIVKAYCSSLKQACDVGRVVTIVYSHLQKFGEISGYAVLSSDFPTLAIRVEFFDCIVAEKVLKLTSMHIAVCMLTASTF